MKTFVLKGRGIEPVYRIPYEAELNAEQLAAVTAGNGPVLVIAGAGTGKTRTLTYRVARLVEGMVPPEAILLLTFTNKAAKEMLRRVEALLGTPSLRVTGGTFHHVGNVILRRHAALLGFPPSFTILDRGDARDLMRSVIGDLGLDPSKQPIPSADALVSLVSFAVNTMRPVDEIVLERHPQFADAIDTLVQIVAGYRDKKLRLGTMDYDDLLLYWLVLLTHHEEAARQIKASFRHVLVDEYQDTNRLQGVLLDTLTADHRNLTVVGDDAQSIYAFRGAHFANILTFPERYPDAQVYPLLSNYRSQPAILDLANASIAVNQRQFKKELRALRPPGGRPLLARCRDGAQQAALVAEYTLGLLDEGRATEDLAILYRANFQSLEIQAELTRRRIPFRVYGGIRFFEQAHIKDVVAFLRAVVNPKDELAWLRLLPLAPKVGSKIAGKVAEVLREAEPGALGALRHRALVEAPKAAIPGLDELLKLVARLDGMREGGPADLLAAVLDGYYEEHMKAQQPNWRARREDLQQLCVFAASYRTASDFLAEVALLDNAQSETVTMGPEEGRPVTLTTVHQAKGLEWPCVLVVGLADGAFPSALALRDPDGEEEERRLYYVALTRAKDELLLTFPATRLVRGQGLVVQKPSRFITEVDLAALTEEMAVQEEEMPAPPSLPPGNVIDIASRRTLAPSSWEADPEISDEDYFVD